MIMLELLGWIATALFASSYFFKRASHLRFVQATAAMLWVGYGFAIGAKPVIAANLLVAGIAVYSGWRRASVVVNNPKADETSITVA